MPQRESLYAKLPDYRVDLEPSGVRVRVSAGGTLVADSRRTLIVRETKHEPVVYFPREDVRFDRLERTAHESFCPFKGEACYFSIRTRDGELENAVWSYEDPFPQVAGLKDYVSFYTDRVVVEEGD